MTKKALFFLIIVTTYVNKTYGQAGNDLPIVEDFETDAVWIWKPWVNRTTGVIPFKTKGAAHSGTYGLNCVGGGYVTRIDKQIGLPGEVISWWVRFQSKTRAYCGFGVDLSEHGYYLSVDPSTSTLHFARSADYTYPLLKVKSQKYKLNVWYRVEVVFNTKTNVTGKLYSANGTTLLNSITLDIPDLFPGGISFSTLSLHLDDIRAGTRGLQVSADTSFAPKLGAPLILKNIAFESNKSTLLPQSYAELDRLANYLKQNPGKKIGIRGHTDNIGNENDNKHLSTERAKSVADYLIKKGIHKNDIQYEGVGSLKPIATNDTEVGRQKNRRVECVINNNVSPPTVK